MDRRILMQMTAPTVVIGLFLFGVCLLSAWSVNHLQGNLARILSQNVTSLEAAQELEITVRGLRFHCFRYLLDPQAARHDPDLLRQLETDDRAFHVALDKAERSANSPREQAFVEQMRVGYETYQQRFAAMRQRTSAPGRDQQHLIDDNPIRPILDPCEQYLEVNKQLMSETRRENERVSSLLRVVLLLLGLVGPASGMLIGWTMARGLTRSIHSLRLRIEGMARNLDEDGSVCIIADGDPHLLDRQVEPMLRRVETVVQRWQQQQRDLIRTQQLSAVGQLAAGVAHEVRNPLMAIKMLVEAAVRPHNPRPLTPESLAIVHREVVRLEQLVREFLDFARPPALERGLHDLRETVQEAVNLVCARAAQQAVEIVIDDSPEHVPADVDRGQLRGVLVNLFLNALDAMPSGGQLRVHLQSSAEGLLVSVRDTGPGIDPQIQARLFTPFVSGKATGTGLGLCICRRVVEQHGGRIDGGNHPAGGACFTITLPPAPPEANHAEIAGH